MVQPLLTWQQRSRTAPLLVQRLWLETIESAAWPRGERKRVRSGRKQQCIGTTFGCTLGQILAHVARPSDVQTRLLRCILDEMLKLADLHSKMQGDDASLLGYGLASCCVLRNQHRKLRGASVRVDTRYGHGNAAIGATAAIIVAHAVLARFDSSAAAYFMENNNLRDSIHQTEERLARWGPNQRFDYHDRQAIDAERRALRRAHIAIDAALDRAESQVGTAIDRLQHQLQTASIAAFPPQRVSEHNDREMQTLARGGAFAPERSTSTRAPHHQQPFGSTLVVPLSGLSGSAPTGGGLASDTSSASWITTSSGLSDASSEFEVVANS